MAEREFRFSATFKTGGDMFWSRVNRRGEDECWDWLGFKQSNGYGQAWADGRTTMAHRVAYQLASGAIPDGYEIDHLCFNKGCVNPEHLEAVTPQTNTLRARALITHCPQGHEYDEHNTYIRPSNGARQCRKCMALACRTWRLSKGERSVRA
jgi:hypothetical protein